MKNDTPLIEATKHLKQIKDTRLISAAMGKKWFVEGEMLLQRAVHCKELSMEQVKALTEKLVNAYGEAGIQSVWATSSQQNATTYMGSLFCSMIWNTPANKTDDERTDVWKKARAVCETLVRLNGGADKKQQKRSVWLSAGEAWPMEKFKSVLHVGAAYDLDGSKGVKEKNENSEKMVERLGWRESVEAVRWGAPKLFRGVVKARRSYKNWAQNMLLSNIEEAINASVNESTKNALWAEFFRGLAHMKEVEEVEASREGVSVAPPWFIKFTKLWDKSWSGTSKVAWSEGFSPLAELALESAHWMRWLYKEMENPAVKISKSFEKAGWKEKIPCLNLYVHVKKQKNEGKSIPVAFRRLISDVESGAFLGEDLTTWVVNGQFCGMEKGMWVDVWKNVDVKKTRISKDVMMTWLGCLELDDLKNELVSKWPMVSALVYIDAIIAGRGDVDFIGRNKAVRQEMLVVGQTEIMRQNVLKCGESQEVESWLDKILLEGVMEKSLGESRVVESGVKPKVL